MSIKVLGCKAYFPSLKDLVCTKISTLDTKRLPQECLDYMQRYKERKFISIVQASDDSMFVCFVNSGSKGPLCYDVTSRERIILVYQGLYEVKLDLLLSSLKQTLSILIFDFQVFIKHGDSFSVMNVFEREKSINI